MHSLLQSHSVESGNFMSTSASLHIRHSGKSSSFSMRSDGYPTHVMKALAHWVTTGGANTQDGIEHNGRALNNAHVCQYSRELRASEGDGLNIVAFPHTKSQNPADADEEYVQIETRSGDWSYLIDLDARTIKVFENVWEGHPTDFDSKTTDPRTYVKVLYPQYQDAELEIINEATRALTDAGFTIN